MLEDINDYNKSFVIYQKDSSVSSVTTYINLGISVLTGVSTISMVVASIMIFIVLYISIIERMKEIGILRAIGSRKSDIQKIFIFEAGLLGFAGGIIACFLSLMITLITNTVCMATLKYALISYHVGYYLLGISLSIVISILAGIAPSMKAANLDPVECFRYE